MLYVINIYNVSQLLNFFSICRRHSIFTLMLMYSLISVVNCKFDKLYTWLTVNKLSLNV